MPAASRRPSNTVPLEASNSIVSSAASGKARLVWARSGLIASPVPRKIRRPTLASSHRGHPPSAGERMEIPVVVDNPPSAYNTSRRGKRVRTSEGRCLGPWPRRTEGAYLVTRRAPARQKILAQPGLDQLAPAPTVPEDERGEGEAGIALHVLGRIEPGHYKISNTIHDGCYFARRPALATVKEATQTRGASPLGPKYVVPQWFRRASMSSSLSILERPSMPISLARSCNSPLVSSSYSDAVPPRLPAAERSVFAILAAFSLLAPSSRSFSYCSSSLMLGPWSLAICSPFVYSRAPNQEVEKVHPHDERLSLETIHSTKRLRSRLMRLAGRPSMKFG